MNLSVVVPVYNSELILPELIKRLHLVLSLVAVNYELVLVNDGSHDGSWEVICQVSQIYDWILGINLMRNYGQHNALLAGIRAAQYEVIVTLDDDLQNPPEAIPKLLEKLNDGYDVVYGTPEKQKHELWRNLASYLTKIALQSSMGIPTARSVSAFRVFRTRLRNAFASYSSSFVCIDVLLTWGTTQFASVKVGHHSRVQGVSNYTFRKLLTHALNMMTGFNTLPLQLASLTGFLFMFFGLGILIYVVGHYLIQGSSVAGFPFLASIIAIFSGVQLFALGIIGEYLARIHFRMMEKPTYVVHQEIKSTQREKLVSYP